jgi:hypothetical protein
MYALLVLPKSVPPEVSEITPILMPHLLNAYTIHTTYIKLKHPSGNSTVFLTYQLVVISGFPIAIASIWGLPQPSPLVGSTTASQLRYSLG